MASTNQGHISASTLWVQINRRVNFATDVSENRIRLLSASDVYVSMLVC